MGGVSRYSERYIPSKSRRDDRPQSSHKREDRSEDRSESKREWDRHKINQDKDDDRDRHRKDSGESKPKRERRDYTMENDGWGGGKRGGEVGSKYNVGRIAALGTRDLVMKPRYRQVKREDK